MSTSGLHGQIQELKRALELSIAAVKMRTKQMRQTTEHLRTSNLDAKFVITWFPNLSGASKSRRIVTLRTLSKLASSIRKDLKKNLPLISPATYGDQRSKNGSLRHNQNLLKIHGIAGDYDGGIVSPEEAFNRLHRANVAALIFTTSSHTEDAPRYRIICRLSHPLSPDAHRQMVKRLNKALGNILAPESFTRSQSFYLGSVSGKPYRYLLLDGRSLDLANELDETDSDRVNSGNADQNDPFSNELNLRISRFGLEADYHLIIAALQAIPNAGPKDWVQWNKMAMAIYAGTGGSDEGLAALKTWSSKNPCHHDDACEERWQHFQSSRPTQAGAGKIFYLATQHGWEDPRKAAAKADTMGDLSNARRLAGRCRGRFLYVCAEARWYSFDGSRWLSGTGEAIVQEAKEVADQLLCEAGRELAEKQTEAAKKNFSMACNVHRNAPRLRAMIDLAWSEENMSVIDATVFDADPWLLGVPGGVVDLKTGLVRSALPGDMISKSVSIRPVTGTFDPEKHCPVWHEFLLQAARGDRELVRFLQQWFGYCLTGDISEQKLVLMYGPGGNGKGIVISTMAGIFGDYIRVAPMEVFAASRYDRHPTELAMMRGARLVVANETEAGRPWAEVRVKLLTGGDVIAARFMGKDFFEFRPTFKLTIAGNHKPDLNHVDAAARRRFLIVPFLNIPTVRDLQLLDRLRSEWPGILRWLIEGCLDWQSKGLSEPNSVRQITTEYFVAQDIMQEWLDTDCEMGESLANTNEHLWDSWSRFATARGVSIRGRTKGFPDSLRAYGFKAIKDTRGIRGRGFAGLRVRPQEPFSGV